METFTTTREVETVERGGEGGEISSRVKFFLQRSREYSTRTKQCTLSISRNDDPAQKLEQKEW